MRFQDWPKRLDKIITARQHTPFAWGTHDCCIFAADVVLELTGQDPAAAVRGTYATKAEAEQLLATSGGITALAASLLGNEIPVRRAQRGDVVIVVNLAGLDTFGVCLGSHCAVPAAAGLEMVPMKLAVSAWRVA